MQCRQPVHAHSGSLDVLERLAVLEPNNPRISRDLAQLRERVDSLN